MRTRFLAAAVILLLALSIHAQMRESIEVRVLELEATVLDRAGHPVEGLKKEDFRVQVGKQEAPVTNFFAVRNGTVLAESSPSPVARQQLAAETSIPTSLVIFVDELHLTPSSRRRAFKALKQYVSANVGANTTAMLIRYYNHFDVRLRPTERPGPILAELERLEKSPIADDLVRERARVIGLIDGVLGLNFSEPVAINGDSPDTIFGRLTEYAERRVTEVERTLTALEEAIDLSSSFTGRRVLLYVSDGLPQTPGLEVFEYWDKMQMHAAVKMHRNGTIRLDSTEASRFDRSSAFRRVAESAQRANVAIYAFDAAGTGGVEGRGVDALTMSDSLNTMSMHANLRAGLQYVAEETGGLYVANENDVNKVLARMSEQFSTYYSIGIQPRRGEIRISVRNRPDLRVVAVRRTPPRSREERLEQSLRSRLYTRSAENPLAITAELGSPAKVNGQCTVPVVVTMSQPALPAELTAPAYDMYLVMLNEQNEETAVQRVSVPVEGQRFARTMMLRVRPERHVLSLAVSNPASDETSFLQREIDATACR